MSKSPQSKPDEEQRKLSQQQEDVPGSKCCLYVGNLSFKVNNSLFKEQFERFGQLDYAHIVYQPGHKSEQISRGYGFVKFKKDSDAIQAHKALNNKDFYGKEWMIQFSKRDKPRAQTPGRYLGHKRREDDRYRGDQRRRPRDRSYSSRQRDRRRRNSRQRRRSHQRRSYDSYDRRDRDRERKRSYERRDRDNDRRRRRDSSEDRNERRRRSRSSQHRRR